VGLVNEAYDAFVSYGHGDAVWVHTLADNLERLGLHVFLDAWELVAGDLIAVRLQEGLAAAGAVVFVVSPNSVGRGWVNEEFAVAVAAAAGGRGRLIPVLAGEVALPPLVAARLYVDFRHVDDPAGYEAKVHELAAAIRGRPVASRPEPGGGIVVPPSAYRAEGPRLARLTITADEVTFSTATRAVRHRPVELDARALAVLAEVERRRARPGRMPLRTAAVAAGTALHAGLVQAGAMLGRCFLDGEAGQALAAEVAAAAAGNAALRLAVDIKDAVLAGLPWETLVLPGQATPLVLMERVEMYRAVGLTHPPAAIQVRGPLRILAVIASPDSGGGELLDYEAELAAIIDAVDPARRGQGAYVQVLNWGSLATIRDALLAQRFHVLHLSCHAAPGVLLLEDAAGRADRVSAARFAAEGLPPDRGVPLVVLAGCSTALADPQRADEATSPEAVAAGDRTASGAADATQTAQALKGLARELLERGVPAVVAMTAPVTDRYATVLGAEVYRELAAREDPVPLAAVSDSRRAVEARRRALPEGDPWAAVAEWATPVLVQAGPPLALYRRADGLDQLAAPPTPVFSPGMVVRRVGEFVGRRAELRELLRALRGGGAGVVVHGIGGVGKSTLAAQLVAQLGADRGLLVAANGAASLTVDLVLEALRAALLTHAVEQGLDDRDPLRQVAAALTDARPPWRDRLELVRQLVLPRLPVLLLVDNAETLLTGDPDTRQVADADLAAFLAAWVQTAPRARLLGTSRYPFTLPEGLHRRLVWHHLGPLSLAETRKLIWRLPALDALSAADQRRAHAMVGGHPRTLEYLDALLRGGTAVFPDVADRLQTALEQRGIPYPQQWLERVAGDLDRALAETITLAADDVLLDGLLDTLKVAPPTRELIGRLAVYRLPVDETGVAWQLSELTAAPDPPADLRARLEPVLVMLRQARQAGTAESVEDLGLDPSTLAQFRRDAAELAGPPVSLTEPARHALSLLAGLGLVAPAATQDTVGQQDGPSWVAHRWTAVALQARTSREQLTAAHRRAAAYWRWRVAVWPQTRADDVEQLLEARYHYHAAGDLDYALSANAQACSQLRTWGMWTTEHSLWDETLGWVSPRSTDAGEIHFQLGQIARRRGNYAASEQHYQAGLAIFEELGDRIGLAISYHDLGLLAQVRGDYSTAEQHYQAALAIKEELGDRIGLARTYHQLGVVAEDRDDYDTAEQHYQAALAIFEELGDRVGFASGYHQLGILAHKRGDYDTAEQRYQASLAIEEELGRQDGIASSYGQLGMLARHRGDYDTAEQRYQAALAIDEEIGDRRGMATSYHQLALIAQDRSDYDTAEQRYQAALAIFEELGDRASTATTLSQLGILLTEQSRFADAIRFQLQSLAIRIELGLTDAAARDVRRLGEQRAAVGDEQFIHVLQTVLDSDTAAAIMRLTERAR
jgi:tetratricopeptide (TPR) repeat protein